MFLGLDITMPPTVLGIHILLIFTCLGGAIITGVDGVLSRILLLSFIRSRCRKRWRVRERSRRRLRELE